MPAAYVECINCDYDGPYDGVGLFVQDTILDAWFRPKQPPVRSLVSSIAELLQVKLLRKCDKPKASWRRDFEEIKIKGDGNCLFRSLSCLTTGTEGDYAHLRNIICNYINEHHEDYADFVPYKHVPAYLGRTRKEIEYGDHVCLQAFANRNGATIHVHFHSGGNRIIEPLVAGTRWSHWCAATRQLAATSHRGCEGSTC
eukprot:gene17922-biopygen12789